MMFPVFGFSINTLSLFGLVLAIGLVVDDAIVVVEAVERHIEEGMDPKSAAMKAMEEISGPVIGIALVLSAVFIPTVFIPGITGRLYQQFAVTIAISVILSAFNALSLSPFRAGGVTAQAESRKPRACCATSSARVQSRIRARDQCGVAECHGGDLIRQERERWPYCFLVVAGAGAGVLQREGAHQLPAR